jgi:hypothetical protein
MWQVSGRSKSGKVVQALDSESRLKVVHGVLDATTNLKDYEGQRMEVSWHVKTFLVCLVLNLAWLSCFLLFAVFPGVVTDCQAHVVPLPLAHQAVGDFRQLGDEPGQDCREK